MDLVIRADRAVIGGEIRAAAVAVADGVIRAVGPIDADYPAAEQIRVADAAALLPGFVDTDVHINEPGTEWEGFATATAAAAAGGITSLIDMPLDSDPVTTTVRSGGRRRGHRNRRAQSTVRRGGDRLGRRKLPVRGGGDGSGGHHARGKRIRL